MKIGRTKLEKIIAEEVKKMFEMKGPFAKQLRQAALGDAYRAAASAEKDSEEERRQKEREFQKAHKAQLASKEGLPDWMLEEEEEEDLFGPASASEMESEKLYDLMWRGVTEYLNDLGTPKRVANKIELAVEDTILDAAIIIRDEVKKIGMKDMEKFDMSQMNEGDCGCDCNCPKCR